MSDRPLSIAFLCTSPGWGGLEMYVPRTGQALAARGHRVLAVVRPGGRVEEACRQAGLATQGLPTGWLAALGIPRLAGILREHRPELLHVQWSRDLGKAVAASLVSPGARLLYTEHMGGRRPKRDPYHRWLYAHVARVFSISAETRRRNLECLPLPPERIQLLYQGVDAARWDPGTVGPDTEARRRELGLPAARRLVGIVGRISRMKGHPLLLEAFARVAGAHPEVDLVIAGDGTGRHGGEPDLAAALAARAAAPDLAGRVHFVGYTPRTPELVAALEVAVVPSENEAFGLTAIEAMALAKPVLVSRSGALPELVDDGRTGISFSPGDPADLATRLGELLADRGRASALGAAARREVLARFTQDRHLDGLVAAYREVLETRPG